jgi:GNAT superfamily N-acetyltransferase
MSFLVKFAEKFLVLSQQLNLYTPPVEFKVISPIPIKTIPFLSRMTLGHDGSNMLSQLENIKSGEVNPNDYAAIIATNKSVLGWALVSFSQANEEYRDPAEFMVDLWINDQYRRTGLGARLLLKAKNYGEGRNSNYVETNHFKSYKEDTLTDKEKKAKFLEDDLIFLERKLNKDKSQLRELEKNPVERKREIDLGRKEIINLQERVRDAKQQLGLLPKDLPSQLSLF